MIEPEYDPGSPSVAVGRVMAACLRRWTAHGRLPHVCEHVNAVGDSTPPRYIVDAAAQNVRCVPCAQRDLWSADAVTGAPCAVCGDGMSHVSAFIDVVAIPDGGWLTVRRHETCE